MKKLVFTVTTDLSCDQRMQRICTTLQGAGFSVTLIGRELGTSDLPQMPYEQIRLPVRFAKGKLAYLEYNLRLFFLLSRLRWDAICAVDLDTLLPAFLVSKWKAKPLVFDAHEHFTEVPELLNRPLTRYAWRLLASTLIPRIRYAYTVGEALARELKSIYGTDFEVFRNLPLREGVEPNDHRVEKPPIFTVIYQGALNVGRGLEVAIDTIAAMQDIQLWICGEGDLSQLLRQRAEKLGAGERIRFWGRLSPDVLRSLTRRAHAGLNLLDPSSKSYYLSFANKAMDYIQAGIPAVCMDFPEYRHIHQAYGVFALLDELCPKKLRAVLERWKMQGEEYQTLVHNCQKAADELVWENEASRLVEFYKRIVV
ncbi:MAG: hypothetical protein KatS3mg029_0516 [Saprospiraceae bacterium]|nr:MAG: hypothetical protein KatS3mg029_0516 [Saprospiraceae bacterium]